MNSPAGPVMERLLDGLNIPFERDVPLAPLTWYGVGGPARILARPASVEQLAALTMRCREQNVPVYVLGSGANLLVLDAGVDGVVVTLANDTFRRMSVKGNVVAAGAGYDLAKLVLESAKAGLSGLECLAGIPASVGGAVRMNAGGTFGDIGRSVARLQVMDATGQLYTLDRDDVDFSYRKTSITARFILEAEFALAPGDPEELMKRVKEVFLHKKNSQPLGDNSAGCAFKNPREEVGAAAGQLIDRAGLKGFAVGGAKVSEHHANFVVAKMGARAGDILAVMEHVQKTVREKFGVSLEREVVVWP